MDAGATLTLDNTPTRCARCCRRCWRRCCTHCARRARGEAPSLAAKEAVYGLLTDLLAAGAPPAWLLPPPADPAAGFEPGLRPGLTRDQPLHTCAPLDAARMAAAMRVFLAAVCGDAVHCARGADGAARAPGVAAYPAARSGNGGEGVGSQDIMATQAAPMPVVGGGLAPLDDIECRRATARLTMILNKPRPDDALAPVLAQPPPLAVPASYAPAAGLGSGQGSAAGALRVADFKWVLGRRALGFLTGLAAGGGAGAEWALLAAPALRAILADAERTVWTRAWGTRCGPRTGSYGLRWRRAAWLCRRCRTPRRPSLGPGLVRTLLPGLGPILAQPRGLRPPASRPR